jgi:hypothetical protein
MKEHRKLAVLGKVEWGAHLIGIRQSLGRNGEPEEKRKSRRFSLKEYHLEAVF